MHLRTDIVILIAVTIILSAGYLAYDYLKKTPPDFLIAMVTRTEEPPPLPPGDNAPLSVPEGFRATIFSRDVPNARVMIRDPKGAMLVSATKTGTVVALTDDNGDGIAEAPITVLEGLRQPHGLFIECPTTGTENTQQVPCQLYVAETNALTSYSYDPDTHRAQYRETLATFPAGRGHFTRTLLMHPDGKRLLISIGSSCNVCNERDPKRATVVAFNLETREETIFAQGLRNSVFLAIHPVTGAVWATENGRDIIGDDIPPDEINIIEEGKHYGWPVCYGKNVYDTDFDALPEAQCEGLTPSHVDLQAHSAALGIAFVPEEGWPEEMWHDALVAFHGSWNRSEPTGYKVVRIDLDENGTPRGKPIDFMTGFLAEGQPADNAIGRPAGLLIEPGGTVYVTDDRAGAIYKVSRLGID